MLIKGIARPVGTGHVLAIGDFLFNCQTAISGVGPSGGERMHRQRWLQMSSTSNLFFHQQRPRLTTSSPFYIAWNHLPGSIENTVLSDSVVGRVLKLSTPTISSFFLLTVLVPRQILASVFDWLYWQSKFNPIDWLFYSCYTCLLLGVALRQRIVYCLAYWLCQVCRFVCTFWNGYTPSR